MKKSWKAALAGSLCVGTISYGDTAADTSSFFDSAWSGMGFVLGYGGHAPYVKYACGGSDPGVGAECDGPPASGLVRKLTGMVDAALTAASLTKCEDIPTSGEKTAVVSGSTMTLTFSEAKNSIPSAWKGGGSKFDRRFEMAGTVATSPVRFVVEGSCKYEHTAFISINMAVGDHAPGYTRPMNVWLGKKGALDVADIYLVERNTAGDIRGAYGFSLEIDEAKDTYKIWGADSNHYDNNSPDQVADVFNLTGNYVEHTISARAKRFVTANAGQGNNTHFDVTALAAMSGATEADLPATANYSMLQSFLGANALTAGQNAAAQGCMDFDAPTTAPTSPAACTGLDWSAAPTPVGDASGSFSAAWIFGTMSSKLIDLPALPGY